MDGGDVRPELCLINHPRFGWQQPDNPTFRHVAILSLRHVRMPKIHLSDKIVFPASGHAGYPPCGQSVMAAFMHVISSNAQKGGTGKTTLILSLYTAYRRTGVRLTGGRDRPRSTSDRLPLGRP